MPNGVTDAPPNARPSLVIRVASGLALVFAGSVLLGSLTELRKLHVPGAPVALTYTFIAVAAITAILHIPPLFRRLPLWGRRTAFFMLVPVVVMIGVQQEQMEPVWSQTPGGKKEIADRAEADRKAAEASAHEAAAQRAKEQLAFQEAADQKAAEHEAQKPELCDITAKQVVDGDKVLEINNIAVETSTEPNEVLTCSGDAITSHGPAKIEFGLVQTPQGKTLVSTRFP